mgnify:FL=1
MVESVSLYKSYVIYTVLEFLTPKELIKLQLVNRHFYNKSIPIALFKTSIGSMNEPIFFEDKGIIHNMYAQVFNKVMCVYWQKYAVIEDDE